MLAFHTGAAAKETPGAYDSKIKGSTDNFGPVPEDGPHDRVPFGMAGRRPAVANRFRWPL
jgi:hypothetical protein